MRPDYDEVRRLVERARAGDASARHSLVEAHIGLAFAVTKDCDDDAVLANVLGKMVEAVNAFLETGRSTAALPSFLKSTLSNEVIDFYREEMRHRVRILKGNVPDEMKIGDDCFEMLDEILACCETKAEELMVELRSQGRSFKEVAAKLGLSISTVHGAIERLEHRYKVKLKLRGACA